MQVLQSYDQTTTLTDILILLCHDLHKKRSLAADDGSGKLVLRVTLRDMLVLYIIRELS